MPARVDSRRAALERLMQERLPGEKAAHCRAVAAFGASFVPILGLSEEAFMEAALLHDICRCLPPAEMLARAAAAGLPIGDLERARPVLLHGPLAAEEGRRLFDIHGDVHEAVYWHTTGRPGLGPLGQALYVADFAEPFRRYPEAALTREILARDGFDGALRYAARARLDFSLRKPGSSPLARGFHAWLCGESH